LGGSAHHAAALATSSAIRFSSAPVIVTSANEVGHILPSSRSAESLEFDLVVLIDPGTFGAGVQGAVDRYVAMTRATQTLVVL
jgi:DNA helicase IV